VELSIYCADVGSVPNGRFGWARNDPDETKIERHRGGTEIIDLVGAVAEGQAVAFGFECPLFVPVPEAALRLGTARPGEGNRSWSAGSLREAHARFRVRGRRPRRRLPRPNRQIGSGA
jgi:hypothetical protein